MKDLAKGYIISMICLVSIYISILVLSIIFDNIWAGFSITVLFLVNCPIIYHFFKNAHPKKIKKLSHQKFRKLKEKENKSLFEELYVKAYNDTAIEILKQVFVSNNIENIKNIDFTATYDKKYIIFQFEYKKHIVYYHVYENKVDYYIDSPKKYDYLKENNEYEKKETIDIVINNYNSIETFLNNLLSRYIQNLNAIDKFEDETEIIVIDQKTMDEIIDYKDFNKSMNIFLNILSIIFIGIMFPLNYVFIKDFNDITNDVLFKVIMAFICQISLDAFAIFSLVYSIYCLVKAKIIGNDIKVQNIDYINGKPYKVKILKTSVGYKHSVHKFCCGVKLYFKDPKKINLVFAYYFEMPSLKKQTTIKEVLTNRNYELAYYKNSKVIVKGMETVRRKLRK